MTIARAQMNRQLYQMGGIGSLPMDYGQSLQVPQQMQPSFSSAQNITMNPLLNYGQTPLTMASGGITRLGYEEGGMGMMEPQMQQTPEGIMNAMPQQMTEPPLQGMEGQQPDIKDPKKALEIIIQMLIAQGIPPEQAREIAMQMIQAVAEGGMGEMSDERIGARFGGSINNGREQYGLGSIFKGVGKAVSGVVKGVTNAVKSVVKSDLGKLALMAAAVYFGGPMLFGETAAAGTAAGAAGTAGALEGAAGLQAAEAAALTNAGVGNSLLYTGAGVPITGAVPGVAASAIPASVVSATAPSLFETASAVASDPSWAGIKSLGSQAVSSLIPSSVGDLASKYGTSVLAGTLGGALAGGLPQQQPGESNEDYQKKVDAWKLTLNQGLSNPTLSAAVNPQNLYPNNPFYTQRRAEGGRIGYQEGGIGDLIRQTTQQEFFGNNMLAAGGIPTRKNPAGITELDYRKKGGYVPPIGIKEKADDIPAMLSNNEFVFTANAVRNAGRGDVNKGAKRMYGLMKQLEAGGMA